MSSPPNDPSEDLSSWLPFMCPSCRGLFRVSVNQSSTAQCPLCQEELQVDLPETAASPRKRRRSSSSPKQAAWDEEQSTDQKNKGSTRWVGFLTVGFTLSVVAALAGVYLFQNLSRKDSAEDSAAKAKKIEAAFQKNPTEAETSLIDFTLDDSQAAAEIARQFLEAETLDDLLPLVRNPDEIGPIIRAYYRSTGYQAPGSYRLEEEVEAYSVKDNFTSFDVIMGDYTKRPIALEITEEGPLVDWESWVGFCEMPWDKLITHRPSSPVLVRVYVEKTFYYNFDFSDDSQWVCFRLSRSGDEPDLYGYCPEGSPLLEKLPQKPDKVSTYTLKIEFPDEAKNGEQVIITDVVHIGWVSGLVH